MIFTILQSSLQKNNLQIYRVISILEAFSNFREFHFMKKSC